MDEDVETLESKHKKEKKELQAQIQALKKASKNDKTKKKELLDQMARLELQLKLQHQHELQDIRSKKEGNISMEQTNLETDGEIENKVRPSKAQKRRDKKDQQEKERAMQIKLQEKENISGPRNLETQAINERLKGLNIALYAVPSDGDCLYKAVSHQLEITKGIHMSVDMLRQNVSHYIRENKDDFIPFMSHPETFNMLTDVEFEEYCEKISNTKVWGGQLEIRALSNYLKCPIKVIQATGPESIDQGTEYEGDSLVLTYHRHMYSLGEHYNSTQPLDKHDSSEL